MKSNDNKRTPNINTILPQKRTYPVRDELKEIAVLACKRFGGMALIDEHYALIDTTKFKVMPK